MQTATVPLTDKLKQSLDINSAIRLIAEWNQNRYSPIESVTNAGVDEGDEFDNDVFPISSIVEPERPTRGILKAWASVRAGESGADGFTSGGYEDRVDGARYTTASEDDKYKYWTSPTESEENSPYAITNVTPTVIYTNQTWANKIYVCFENSYASPTNFTVSITTDGTNWTVVATNPTIDDKGRVTLYRQANGSWSSTVHRESPLSIRGVRVSVTNMNKGAVRCNLIELGARLESDLSYFVISYDADYTMSDTSFIAPIGKASSNDGNIVLDNTDSRFTNDNPSTLYYGILDKNVELRLDIGINKGTIEDPDFEWFRQLTMRSENWSGQSPDTTTVQVKDASEYLQSIKPNPVLYMDMTVGEIIWRLLDSVGFSNWNYEPSDSDGTTQIPQFWASGDETVWEVIQQLAEATQTAIYFDEFGVLQIKTRSIAFNLTNEPVWQLNAVNTGSTKADIVELNTTNDFEANVVNITYRPTSLSKENEFGGLPIMESVWEPEDTVVLRSSQLKQSMTTGSTSMVITPAEAVTWPYEGIVQIEGEFIRYSGKGYGYYDAAGAWKNTYIKSAEDKAKLDKLNPTLAYKNRFNGYMWIGEGNRGIWNTTPMAHSVDIGGWTYNRYTSTNSKGSTTTPHAWNGGLIHNKDRSTVTLRTKSTFSKNHWYVCTRGSRNDSPPYWYGTRLKFDSTATTYGAAGIVMTAGDYDNGFYIELVRTDKISATERAKWTHELCFYVKYNNGTIKRIGPNGGKGVPMLIAPGVWYDLDVHFEWQGTTRVVSIMVNGVTKMTAAVPVGLGTGESIGGRYGLFTRGFTSAEFEYIYASTYAINDTFDDEGWFDWIKGGYKSGQWEKEWVYSYRTNTKTKRGKSTKVKARYASRMMDEFGPIVHEVRELDVKFTKTPVVHSNLYFSNESQIICPEYNANPFGAKFVLANTSRDNAVVSGEDTLTFGADNAVDQKLLIYGRTFTQEDEKVETVKDEQGIKRRGEVVTDFSSPWIQSEGEAKALGGWIVDHWSGGNDEVEVEVFGNPLLQLTDVISVNYPSRNMSPSTHKYFIVAISHSYDNGLETTLTLRRMKI